MVERRLEFAFLTVVGDIESGLIGGCLILNDRGRPVEFHCTAPVQSNRAQQILYGPTLRPYLVGERITTALMGKTKSAPLVLWTDDADVFVAGPRLDSIVALMNGASTHEGVPAKSRFQIPGTDQHAWCDATNVARVREAWEVASYWIEVEEPFERIRAAIDEARQALTPTPSAA